jgi:hypothetical protein
MDSLSKDQGKGLCYEFRFKFAPYHGPPSPEQETSSQEVQAKSPMLDYRELARMRAKKVGYVLDCGRSAFTTQHPKLLDRDGKAASEGYVQAEMELAMGVLYQGCRSNIYLSVPNSVASFVKHGSKT